VEDPSESSAPRSRAKLWKTLGVVTAAAALVGTVYVVLNMEHTPPGERELAADSRAKLKTLGYVGGTEITEREATEAAGVVARDADKEAEASYSMWTALAWDQIDDEADQLRYRRRVHLIDDAGNLVHEWVAPEGMRRAPNGWANMTLAPNGDLLAVDAKNGIVRLDWDSKLVWAAVGRFHHEAQVVGDSLWALRSDPKRLPTAVGSQRIWAGTIVELDLESGEERRVIHTWDALREIPEFDRLVQREIGRMNAGRDRSDWTGHFNGKVVYDVLHQNSLHVLTPDLDLPEGWKAGDVLTCFRNVELVVLFDGVDGHVKWYWGVGELDRPHDPTLVEGGRVLLFDNGTKRRWSRVIEVDTGTGEIVWQFRGSKTKPFYSQSRGLAQRLANGNTLVSESTRGRVFELTPKKRTVWEFVSPLTYKAVKKRPNGPTGSPNAAARKRLRAALRMVRLEGGALQATRDNLARGGDGVPD
jgi:hypothetical protein